MSETSNNRIKKLPLWAQKLIKDKDFEISKLQRQNDVLNAMMPWTADGVGWFTMGVHRHEPFKLFILNKDHAQQMCTVGENDRIFIGRGKSSA